MESFLFTLVLLHVDASHVIDALSASFFGLLGIWAAVDRRHWFVRFVVVSGILLVMLLIPAYEVVIEFGLQIMVIMAGVWLARGRRHWRPRLSLETALLSMVVVAVTTAVIARIPDLHLGVWAFLFTVGFCTGSAGLLALWVVCGRAPFVTRVLLGLLGLGVFVLLFHFGQAMQHALWRSSAGFNRQALFEFYSHEQIVVWMSRILPSIALAAVILITALILARASRWFAIPPARDLPRRAIAARVGLGCMLFAIVAPLGYLFYRLLMPPSLELMPELPSPNGFDDFIAAGQMVPPTMSNLTIFAPPPPLPQLAAEFKSLQPVFDRIALGLKRQCYADVLSLEMRSPAGAMRRAALRRAEEAMLFKFAYVNLTGTLEERIEAVLEHVQFTQEAYRGTGLTRSAFSPGSTSSFWIFNELATLLPKLDARQCRAIARRMFELEQARETLNDQQRVQRLIAENDHWETHMRMLLSEWSGRDLNEWAFGHHVRFRVEQRGLIVRYALRAYCLENKRLPPSLNALVPEYLPALPADPYGAGPMKARLTIDRIAVYSVGEDGDDDGGVKYAASDQGVIDTSDGDHSRPISSTEVGLGAAE